MNLSRMPWWAWLIAVFVLLRVAGAQVPVLPLIIVGAVLVNVLGRGRRPGGHRGHGRVGHGGQPGSHPRWPQQEPWEAPGEGGPGHPGPGQPPPPPPPMPTIDVPRYPGSPEGAAGPAASGSTSADPVVSLGQLHLTRAGNDLQRAASRGTAAELTRTLEEVHDLVDRLQSMLAAASGTSGAGRDAFAKGLRVLDGQVRRARGEHPPGARVTSVVQTCLRMGQTGRHE